MYSAQCLQLIRNVSPLAHSQTWIHFTMAEKALHSTWLINSYSPNSGCWFAFYSLLHCFILDLPFPHFWDSREVHNHRILYWQPLGEIQSPSLSESNSRYNPNRGNQSTFLELIECWDKKDLSASEIARWKAHPKQTLLGVKTKENRVNRLKKSHISPGSHCDWSPRVCSYIDN